MYRDNVLALAAKWKLGANATAVMKLLPEARQEAVSAAAQKLDSLQGEQLSARIAGLGEREERRITLWGQKRFGTAAWDRLEPRVRSWLVKNHGRNH